MAKEIKIRGINLVFDDLGTGEVVFFVHGQPFNRSMWAPQIKTFSETHRLIIPDLRGYGDSISPKNNTIILLDELALDLLHLLEELHIAKAVFVGLSMGGQVVLELYRLAPRLFKGLVLADTDARAETEDSYKHRLELATKIKADGMEKFTDERIHLFMCDDTFKNNPEAVAHLREMMITTNAASSAAVQRGRAERRDHANLLSEINIPALIIVGEEDEFTPIATAKFMHDRIKQSKLSIIKNSGHIPNMEQPGAFNKVLADFLNQLK
ncbi:alpha/beta fold hydrolase [Mucilaginibacter sp. dw_454]|uniref:alpha/beta fold hydrolase n=1 Tax=Mucilaginibacter sp. dw_454 TaxID=2720079 RepID=UPI001BD4E440|nr:alpha/beta fold hydrolase [Mucilaginibacter sp. dw_454]